ncbi:Lsr2 family protein [Streptomyces sp. TRM66268-LWL]|uniref:Lsr2 family protein n=2 Tax=Streptomyces polyasparticus TaxID=2767826 RepID=A0ABR7SQR8_9ACTN|nr:Lsr2 family protein [Streptomyces polyasparticus]
MILDAQDWDSKSLAAWLAHCGLEHCNGQLSIQELALQEGSAQFQNDTKVDSEPNATFDISPRNENSSASDIRSWARRNGYTVGIRGRIPQVVQDAYADAMKSCAPTDSQPNTGAVDRHQRSLSQELNDLASAVSEIDPYATLGSLLIGDIPLPRHARETVKRILNAKATEAGWLVVDASPEQTENARPVAPNPRRGTLKARAHTVLSEAQHPLLTARLVERMGSDVNERSLKIQLAADPTFTRSDIDSWALASWELRPYTSLKDLVAEEVDDAGGSVASDVLIRKLTRSFSINEASLRQTMSTYPFTSKGGIVRRLSDDYDDERHDSSSNGTRKTSPAAGRELARDLGLDF